MTHAITHSPRPFSLQHQIPENMESEWLVLQVPMGKRSLIVASHNQTCSFSKGGMHLNTFNSQLPNGSRGGRSDHNYLLFDSRNAGRQEMLMINAANAMQLCLFNSSHQTFYSAIHSGETMLDCIFSSHYFAYFILDLLLWRDYDVRDCDTEFRMWFVFSCSPVFRIG